VTSRQPVSRGHLEGIGIVKRFGGLTAVDDVSVETEAGTIAALIGPNGAGKTTLFQCLTGVEDPDAGVVRLDGLDITSANPDARARLGIGRTFQRLAVFPTMTAADNLLVGSENRTSAHVVRRVGWLLAGLVGVTVGDRAEHRRRTEEVLDLLGLQEVRDVPAGTLSTGTLRLVELGRALCHDPIALLLDEPASGLDTMETVGLQRVLRDVAATGVAILLVEHDVDLVFDLADRVYAMAEGRVIAAGRPDEVRASAAVREAYLDVNPAVG
jgi:branched-chain amino acid transport system ATP-binding protein